MQLLPIVFAVAVNVQSTPSAQETIHISPPLIMPGELIKIQEKVLPPPTPVQLKNGRP